MMSDARLWVEQLSDERLWGNMTDSQSRPLFNASADFLISLAGLGATDAEMDTVSIAMRDRIRAVNQRLKENAKSD